MLPTEFDRTMPMKQKWFLFVIALLVALAAIAGLYKLLGGQQVDVIHPQRGMAVDAAYATGTVEATIMLPIAPRRAARLEALFADEGSEVSNGQILAQLENTDLENAVKELEARVQYAEREYQRQQTLRKSGTISKEALDRAHTEWEALKASLAKAKTELSYMQLKAPADGRVIRRDGEVGELIAVNQPVFWLSCCAPLRISAEVDEEDIAEVKVGQKVLIRADAFPGQVFHGDVQAITPKGDPVARSYRVRIGFTDPDTPLMIGMTAETNIILNEKDDALLLPASTAKDGKIWVIDNGRLEHRAVSIGVNGLEKVEILDGVTTNDLVIREPNDKLKEGKRVRTSVVEWNE